MEPKCNYRYYDRGKVVAVLIKHHPVDGGVWSAESRPVYLL
jgi:hypothetical protein